MAGHDVAIQGFIIDNVNAFYSVRIRKVWLALANIRVTLAFPIGINPGEERVCRPILNPASMNAGQISMRPLLPIQFRCVRICKRNM